MRSMIALLCVPLLLLVFLPVAAQETPPPDAIQAALADLNEQVGAELTLENPALEWSWSEETFGDTSLGCPQPDMMYAQVLTQGYTFLFTYEGTVYDYRAMLDGQSVVLCETRSAEAQAAPADEATEVLPVETAEAAPETGLSAETAVLIDSVEGQFAAPLLWSPTGRTLAVAARPDAEGDETGTLLLFNPDDLAAEPQSIQTGEAITALTYYQAEPVVFLVTGGLRGGIAVLQVEPEGFDILPMQTDDGQAVNSVAINTDGTVIASASGTPSELNDDSERAIHLWNANTGARIRTVQTDSPVGSLTFSPDGAVLAYGGLDGVVRLLEINTRGGVGNEIALEGHTGLVRDLVFSPDGTRLVSGSMDGTARLWTLGDEAAGEAIVLGAEGDEPVLAVAFSPDGAFVATAGGGEDAENEGNAISLWDAASGDLLATLPGDAGAITDLAFSPDGTRFASIGENGVLMVWGLNGAEAGS